MSITKTSNSLPIPRLFEQKHSSVTKIPEDNDLESGYYIHKKSLGEGGFGKVRLGTHLKTNQKVAIKMMNKERLGQDLQRVRIEVESLKVLQHENIAKMLQVIETDTEIFLILEYCSGGELFDYLIAKKRLTESEVRIIMKDLFKVLLYIHNHGFAHRDLKPENILFDSNHRIKLIDFGLAANSSKNKAALSFLQTCCGSPAYAAPELLRGLTYSGPAVDVWSAGVLLYSLLVGRLPFDDDNVNNLYKKIQVGRFVMPQWLSSDVRDLINTMLKTNPADRITVSKALEHRWIRKGFLKPSPPDPTNNNETSPLSPSSIDPKAFQCLRLLFPRISELDLKEKLKEFGYVTSTYLLLKNNSEVIQEVQMTHQLKMKPLAQQRQQLINANVNQNSPSLITNQQPRIAAIKRKLQLDGDNSPNTTPTSAPNTPVFKKIKENVPNQPQTNVTGATTPLSKPVVPPRMMINGINQTPITAKCPQILVERNKMLMAGNTPLPPSSTNHQTTPYPAPRTPPRMSIKKTPRRILSPKLVKKSDAITATDENRGHLIKSPEPLMVNQIKSPLREVRNQVLSPPVKQSPDILKLTSPKPASPVIKKPESIDNKTPTKTTPISGMKKMQINSNKASTKKSLLRRLMASATPQKSHQPRKLDHQAVANNITLTSYKDPQECIDRLTKVLQSKGVQCKQKEYVKLSQKKQKTFTKNPFYKINEKRKTFILKRRGIYVNHKNQNGKLFTL